VSDRDVTIFDSVGFALEIFLRLRYLLRIHHEERGAQQQIDLLPDLDDPKDLFALLLPEPQTLAARPGVPGERPAPSDAHWRADRRGRSGSGASMGPGGAARSGTGHRVAAA